LAPKNHHQSERQKGKTLPYPSSASIADDGIPTSIDIRSLTGKAFWELYTNIWNGDPLSDTKIVAFLLKLPKMFSSWPEAFRGFIEFFATDTAKAKEAHKKAAEEAHQKAVEDALFEQEALAKVLKDAATEEAKKVAENHNVMTELVAYLVEHQEYVLYPIAMAALIRILHSALTKKWSPLTSINATTKQFRSGIGIGKLAIWKKITGFDYNSRDDEEEDSRDDEGEKGRG